MALTGGEVAQLIVSKGFALYESGKKAFESLPPKENRKITDYAKAFGAPEGTFLYGIADFVDAVEDAAKS